MSPRAKPHVPGTKLTPRATCGALTQLGDGPPCSQNAGHRTDHPGEGRCWLHGGRSGSVTHGRYSMTRHTRLRELIAKHLEDPDPLNILPELASLRALFEDFIERHATFTAALLAWHESYAPLQRPLPQDMLQSFRNVVDEWEDTLRAREEPSDRQTEDIADARKFIDILGGASYGEPKPRQVLDIADAYRILAEIGKMVERIDKMRTGNNAVSRAELNRIVQQFWLSVDGRVSDEAVKASIKTDWLSVKL